MYREYRDVTLNGAVSQMYQEMSGRHSARHECIHIIKAVELKNSEIKRNKTLQFTKTNLRFPKMTTIKRAPTPAHKSTFNASRPKLI
jgi:large subunit ribosomal protein L18Ae